MKTLQMSDEDDAPLPVVLMKDALALFVLKGSSKNLLLVFMELVPLWSEPVVAGEATKRK